MPRLPFSRKDQPHVFVTRELPGDAGDRLRARVDADVWERELPPPREELIERAATAEGLLCLLTDNIDAGLIEALPRLRVISTMAVGYDHIDVAAATARGIAVTNTPGVLTETTADLAFALILAAARRIAEGERAVREGRWTSWHPSFLLGHDVHGATLGIVGLGAIGQAVARRAAGFGMRVLYSGSWKEAERALQARHVTFEELLEQSDIVSVHAPLTAETRHMFNDEAFARMKPDAVFVNTARGGLVDETALLHALESRRLAAAAIDVTEVEPLPTHDPLLRLPNLLVTPHIGSASIATRARMAGLAVDNLLAVLDGKRPAHCVNPEVLD